MMTKEQGLSWSPEVKLLFFDAGKVFIKFDWEEVRRGFARRSGRSELQVKEAFAYLSTLGYESGGIDTLGFLAELNQQLATVDDPIGLDEFEKLWTVTFEEDPQMAQLLQALKQRYPLHMISNTNESQKRYLQRKYNYTRHFLTSTFSDEPEVSCSKPGSRIYLMAFARAGVVCADSSGEPEAIRPENCLYIDDLPANVDEAIRLGTQGVVFTGYDNLIAELKRRGVSW